MPSGRRGEEMTIYAPRISAWRAGQLRPAVPTLPVRSCGYREEQRSPDTATAWRPLSPNAAEQALSWLVPAFRAQGPQRVRIAAGHRLGI